MSTSPLLRQLLKKANEAEKNKERKKKKKAAARDAGSSSHAVTATTPSVESRTSEKTTSSLLTSHFMAVSFQEFFVESLEESPATREEEVWRNLRESIVYYDGKSVGTLAAKDQVAEALSYNQVFVGDFIPAGLAFLMKKPAESEIEKNFLIKTLHLQGREKKDNFTDDDSPGGKETVFADFGGSAIGRVAPVDSGFWWIIFLRAYAICTGDHTLQERPEMQKGMIDRWMGINERRDDLIDEMPLQVAYPALEGDERKTITGFDPKNMRWSYHNGGSCPTLLWKTALTSAVGSGTEVTGTLPPAASPALGKDGASKPVEGKRKREEGSDGGGDRVRRPRVLQEVNLQPAIAEGSMAVFWKSRNGYCQLLGMVEGVQHMMDRGGQLEDAVEQVLNEHNRPINRDKIYYSQWTNMRMHVLFITRMPWQMFRTAVRGVHVIGVEEDVGLGAEEGGGVQVEEGDDSDEEVEADEEVGEGVPVYWRYVSGFARRLETIQGVRQMRTKREFVDEIEEVLTRHNRPTDRVKMYFSLLTSLRATLLSIRRMPWFQFRGEVRGVQVDALDGDALLGAEQQVEAAAGEVAEDNFSGNNP